MGKPASGWLAGLVHAHREENTARAAGVVWLADTRRLVRRALAVTRREPWISERPR